jgi:hypothetical protein
MKLIKLDYDGMDRKEIAEWIDFASKITNIKIKRITMFSSRNGGTHVYVYVPNDVTDIQIFMFKYYANEDRRRVNADIRRWKYGYPKDYSYLFYAYINKPKASISLPNEFEFFINVLAIANEYYPLY